LLNPPDLAGEVLSPRHCARRFAAKIACFLVHGVLLIWVVGPGARSIDVYRPGHPTEHLVSGDVLEGYDVLPGLRVGTGDLLKAADEA